MVLDIVKSNLPLFQYILGPEVTPEKLLTKLTDPNESFHNVLNENKTLIGILLGFGTHNHFMQAVLRIGKCFFF